ncbi:hypothetical protein JG687_00009126 [Phytophthora cactorum]|uniref:Uncharacterized protein n=1 Tax=Phytophthora cactorum TaxID=29920 RepID=A0A329S0I6_9STRA|nr:hypothetical protein PC112_g15437 [Phytophthora cactorum]KAG2891029.1 hypothetical protein PC114_g17173 [Phytophthora cactorum]KAG3148297.1 hypothetical protein C6341_g17443 [Phytophthora cactorum]KAG3215346.1 hypothetical protein PC129_g13777 [Phytophthora cactorum]KAG4048622.1 hypothetical protein PC123_g16076 [Phytophthora cactorum]
MLSIVLRPMRWVWSLGKTPRCTRCAGSRSVLSLRCFSSTILTGDSGLSVSEEEVCKVKKLRSQKLQVVWDTIVLHRYASFISCTATQTSRKKYRHDAWPALSWGYKLGLTVKDIRHRKLFLNHLENSESGLKRMELCYKTTTVERDWNEKVLPSLEVFRQEFGHCLVGKPFKVPTDPKWPRKAWGCIMDSL